MNNNSNRDYATENMNLKQQIMDLKKEIVELKDQVAYLKEDGEEWQSAYEWSQAQNAILKLKNQELIEQLKLSNESQETVINTMNLVSQENEKLKKAIEILKDILNLNVTQDKHNNYFLDGDIITEITKEQYDLLKEVLKLFQ